MTVGDFKPVSGVESQHIEELGAPSAEQAIRNRETIRAIRTVNQAESFGADSELRYTVEHDTGKLLIRIVDKATNEVIRQVPSETVLRVAEAIRNLLAQEQGE